MIKILDQKSNMLLLLYYILLPFEFNSAKKFEDKFFFIISMKVTVYDAT